MRSKTSRVRSILPLKFIKENITLTRSLEVHYRYKVSSQELLDSWQDKRITGFRLSWYLQDSNGSILTETIPSMPEDWKSSVTADANYQNQFLADMVQLAKSENDKNMSRYEQITKTIKEKEKCIQSGSLKYNIMCFRGQIKPEYYNVLNKTSLKHDGSRNDDDIKTGFMIFSSLIYCSESVALSQFLQSLLSNQSPRSIIQATVNTIQSGTIKENVNRKILNQFYMDLDKIMEFKFGKILLALSSPPQLEAIRAKNWPYLSHYSKEINHCLSGDSCQGVSDIVQTLGKILNMALMK